MVVPFPYQFSLFILWISCFMRNLIYLTISILVSGSLFWNVFALTPKEEKWVITIESPALSYTSPERFTPFPLEEAPEDVEYWTSIIPYTEDRNEDMYVVLPTLWLITPVVFVPEWSQDNKDMTSWKEIDINKYLVEWVMHYASSGMPWDIWNPVIFWHSNYFADKPGKYKSIFADIMAMDVGPTDEMWVFAKNDSGEYDLKKFTISESYETHPTDVEILRPKWGKELTVFWCTNWLKWRWILRGREIESNEILVPYLMKYDMHDITASLKGKPDARKKKIVVEWVKAIENIRKTIPKEWLWYEGKLKKYVLNYIERELVKIY